MTDIPNRKPKYQLWHQPSFPTKRPLTTAKRIHVDSVQRLEIYFAAVLFTTL